MVHFDIVPSKTAYLVVDLQRLFVEDFEAISSPDGLDVVKRTNALARVCRQHGVAVIFIAHQLRDDGSNLGVLGQVHPALHEKGLLKETSQSATLHSAVEFTDGDIFLPKPRFGAFSGTDLNLILRGKGIDTVIIGGIATNICVETTAREANHLEYKVIFLSDGTANTGIEDKGWGALSPAEAQKATLTTIAYLFGEVASCDEVARRIAAASRA